MLYYNTTGLHAFRFFLKHGYFVSVSRGKNATYCSRCPWVSEILFSSAFCILLLFIRSISFFYAIYEVVVGESGMCVLFLLFILFLGSLPPEMLLLVSI